VILKTAKQERTVNPDTRLHSDEMRETDGKNRRLARNPKEETSLEASEGPSRELIPLEVIPGCCLQLRGVSFIVWGASLT
jgi:hypothetical protein